VTRARHLARRFFGSLRPRPVDEADVMWVRRVLTPSELHVWEALGGADRAESVAVAHRAARALGPDADPVWIAAALLHDAGKTDAGLGTFGRAGATVVGIVMRDGRARRLENRIGRYLAHDDIGAELLRAAGARPEVSAWAGAHHRREQWPATGLPAPVATALAEADGV
jgi:putative nucleotidyltransferase with HDIG domain